MIQRIGFSVILVSAICAMGLASVASAKTTTETSEATAPTSKRLYLSDEMVGIKPAIGANTYNDSQGGRSTRFSYGFAAEMNAASLVGLDFTRIFIGPQTGFTFSHIGNADSDWFGSSSTVDTGEGGANLLMIPVNLKLAIAPTPWLRTGIHGGGNVLYRSIPSAVVVDDTDLDWRLIPNVGADVEFALSSNAAITIRPDWTLSSTDSLFSAIVALGITI